MRALVNRFKLKNRITFATLALTVLLFSCIDSSPYFGNEMLPPDQIMNSSTDNSIKVKTYVIKRDSMRGSNLGTIMYVGQYNSEMVGRTTTQLFSNYSAIGFVGEDEFKNNFGKSPRIDSLILQMSVKYTVGDSLKPSSINISRVNGVNFKYENIYYTNFNIKPYVAQTPLLTVKLTGTKKIKAKLPIEYAKEHLDTRSDENSIYYSASNMHDKFNGLYFEILPESNEGALYEIDLSNTYMTLYYNNKDFPEHPDTVLTHSMAFYAKMSNGYPYPNTSLQMYKNDYSLANTAAGGVQASMINDTINQQKRAYITGMSGIGALVEIPRDEIQLLVDKCKSEYGPNVGIGIHRATLKWQKIDGSWESLNKTFSALGLYYNIEKRLFLAEYQPIIMMEQDITNTFGLLTRSTATYSMDITKYVQKLIRDPKAVNRVEMFPDYYLSTNPQESILWGGGAEKDSTPSLEIVYTIVK